MTEDQVRMVLGDPSAIREESGVVWIYEHAMNPGWVEVDFDHDRRFSSFNDESVFPAQ